MSRQPSSDSCGFLHLVERQMLLQTELHKLRPQNRPAQSPGPFRFITISRDAGSLGDQIASDLGRQLGWPLYDKEIVDYIARHSHVRQALVDQLDEHARNRIHDTIRRFLQPFGNDEYHVGMLKALVALAAREHAIILGHGGAFALRDQPGLHIRITASLSQRVGRLALDWGLSLEETRRRVVRVDADRRSFIRFHFHEDREDTRFYHVIFNTDHFTASQVAGAIVGMVQGAASAETVHEKGFETSAAESSRGPYVAAVSRTS